VFQLILMVFAEFGLETAKAVREGVQEAEKHPPAAAGCLLPLVGLFFVGAALGGLSLLMRPERLFQPGPLKGWSIAIVPVVAGAAMHAWGTYREAKGKPATTLASFIGGASFALGATLVRYLGVG